jgi:hypothetical protein
MDIQTRKVGESLRVLGETKASEAGATPSKPKSSGRIEDMEDEELDEDYRRGEADAREKEHKPKKKKTKAKKVAAEGGDAGDGGVVEEMSLKSSNPAADKGVAARRAARQAAALEAASAAAAVDERGGY